MHGIWLPWKLSRGEPYTNTTVSSWHDKSKKAWIAALLANVPASLATWKKSWMCVPHVGGKWQPIQGVRKQ